MQRQSLIDLQDLPLQAQNLGCLCLHGLACGGCACAGTCNKSFRAMWQQGRQDKVFLVTRPAVSLAWCQPATCVVLHRPSRCSQGCCLPDCCL